MSRIESDLIVAGTVTADDPTLATHLATKNYVDTKTFGLATFARTTGLVAATYNTLPRTVTTYLSSDLTESGTGIAVSIAGWYSCEIRVVFAYTGDSFLTAGTIQILLAPGDVIQTGYYCGASLTNPNRMIGALYKNSAFYAAPLDTRGSITGTITSISSSMSIKLAQAT